MHRATVLQIAREGWPFILVALALSALFAAYVNLWLMMPFLLIAGCGALFFHEPYRSLPCGPRAVVAPVDSQVVDRRTTSDPYIDRQAIRISLEINPIGAYCLRAAVEGKVLELIPGERLPPGITASWIRTDEGDDVVMVITRGSLFGARPCIGNFGDRVGQGRRCGFRRLAHHMDVYIPANARINVRNGQTVTAGQDALAYLVHKDDARVASYHTDN